MAAPVFMSSSASRALFSDETMRRSTVEMLLPFVSVVLQPELGKNQHVQHQQARKANCPYASARLLMVRGQRRSCLPRSDRSQMAIS